jgi:hypothetical protein
LIRIKWAGIIFYYAIETILLTFSVVQWQKFENYTYEKNYKYFDSYRMVCGSAALVGLLLIVISSVISMIGIHKIIKTINLVQKSAPNIKSKKGLLVIHILLLIV